MDEEESGFLWKANIRQELERMGLLSEAPLHELTYNELQETQFLLSRMLRLSIGALAENETEAIHMLQSSRMSRRIYALIRLLMAFDSGQENTAVIRPKPEGNLTAPTRTQHPAKRELMRLALETIEVLYERGICKSKKIASEWVENVLQSVAHHVDHPSWKASAKTIREKWPHELAKQADMDTPEYLEFRATSGLPMEPNSILESVLPEGPVGLKTVLTASVNLMHGPMYVLAYHAITNPPKYRRNY